MAEELPNNSVLVNKEESRPVFTKAANDESNPDAVVEAADATFWSKIGNSWIVRNVKDLSTYMWKDIVAPALLNGAHDFCARTLEAVFYGKDAAMRFDKRVAQNGRGFTSYDQYYKSKYGSASPVGSPSSPPVMRNRERWGYENEGFYTAQEAKSIMEQIKAAIDQTGYVRVSEYLEIYDKISQNYMCTKWGWRDVSKMRGPFYDSNLGKFVIDMPDPVQL